MTVIPTREGRVTNPQRSASRGTIAVLLTSAVVLASASSAHAETVQGGRLVEGENVVRGSGSGTADVTADASTGAISTVATAVGGNDLLPIPIPLLGGPTSAGPQATISNSYPVTAGEYDVSVVYHDATSSRELTGSRASAYEMRVSSVFFVCETGCGEQEPVEGAPGTRFEDMPDGPQTVTSDYRVVVPDGATGSLHLQGTVLSSATAHRRGNRAESRASVSALSFEIDRLG